MYEVWATIWERSELIKSFQTRHEADKAAEALKHLTIPNYGNPMIIPYRGGIPGLKLTIVDNQTDTQKQ